MSSPQSGEMWRCLVVEPAHSRVTTSGSPPPTLALKTLFSASTADISRCNIIILSSTSLARISASYFWFLRALTRPLRVSIFSFVLSMILNSCLTTFSRLASLSRTSSCRYRRNAGMLIILLTSAVRLQLHLFAI